MWSLLRRLVVHDAPAPSVRVYMAHGATVRGQLVGAYEDALVLVGACVLADGQTKDRPLTGAVRIARECIDFFVVL
jgi:hypothetical protein